MLTLGGDNNLCLREVLPQVTAPEAGPTDGRFKLGLYIYGLYNFLTVIGDTDKPSSIID